MSVSHKIVSKLKHEGQKGSDDQGRGVHKVGVEMLARWCLLDWVGTKAKVASRAETCAQCAGEEAGEAGGGGGWQVLQPFHFHPVFPPAPAYPPKYPPCAPAYPPLSTTPAPALMRN